jgi:hypothetical protein
MAPKCQGPLILSSGQAQYWDLAGHPQRLQGDRTDPGLVAPPGSKADPGRDGQRGALASQYLARRPALATQVAEGPCFELSIED